MSKINEHIDLIVITLGVLGLLFLMCFFGSIDTSAADKAVFLDIYTAKGNVGRMLIANALAAEDIRSSIYETIERSDSWYEVETWKKRLEEEASYENHLKTLFGYIPTEEEIQLFLGIVQAECGDTEPEAGIDCVVECIARRVRDPRFPNTIYGVISQRNQFETFTRQLQGSVPNNRVRESFKRTVESGGERYPGILFFTAGRYNAYCRPGFVIGNHYFGYMP